jgi:hypothetical protein
MKKKIFLAGLLVALTYPAVHATGVNLGGGSAPEQMNLPSLIAPLNTGLVSSSAILKSNPRSLYINGDYKFGPRIESRVRCDWENRKRSVPEPEGIAAAIAAGILGLGYAGYTFGQRRRVHGAA